jgi:hypothetical protein
VWDAHDKLVKAASALPIDRHVWLLGLPDITYTPMNLINESSPLVPLKKGRALEVERRW